MSGDHARSDSTITKTVRPWAPERDAVAKHALELGLSHRRNLIVQAVVAVPYGRDQQHVGYGRCAGLHPVLGSASIPTCIWHRNG